LIKGLVSIGSAWSGFGAWSLIIGQLSGAVSFVLANWKVMPWRPVFRFSPSIARTLLSYGLSIVALSIITAFQSNSDYLLIGHFMGAEALGVYSLAFRIPDLIISQFCSVVSSVIFPYYATMRDNLETLQYNFLTATRYLSLINIPIGLGIALVARPLVIVAFSEKWIEAIPVIQAISIYAMMISIAYNAGDIYKAQGKPSLLVIISISIAFLQIPALVWAAMVARSVVVVGWVQAGIAALESIVQLIIASRMLSISIGSILNSLKPAVVNGLLMAAAVWGTMTVVSSFHPILQLIASVGVGAICYCGLLFIFQRPLAMQIFKLFKKVFVKA
jgi:O-antigen/teichoic acid export membrane protein